MSRDVIPRRPLSGGAGLPPRLTPAVVWSLLGETLYEWYEDRAPRLGAALAYYTVFALAPGLIVIIAVTALVLGKAAAQGQIITEVQDLVGVAGAQAIGAAIESAGSAGSSLYATSLGLITLVFGLWGVFGELQDALNTIWGVTTKPGRGVLGIIKARFWSFTVVVGVGFLLLVSLTVSTGISGLRERVAERYASLVGLIGALDVLASLVIVSLLFALIYRYMPARRTPWRIVVAGGVLTALLFDLGRWAIGLYLAHSTQPSAYGAAASFAALLLWLYYTAQIFLFGAEFTACMAGVRDENSSRRLASKPERSMHARASVN